ncbi:MAG: helix-turn-helix transcriptional regulator [Spirochaetales bacterium]|nr:helix-turn-helix transcriptional regulator [Spirochaetales bacterium]
MAHSFGTGRIVSQPRRCTVATSCRTPRGGGAQNPNVLLEPKMPFADGSTAFLDEQRRTFDTFEGPQKSTTEDWYELRLAQPYEINRFVMIAGFPYVDGGWWTSFALEYFSRRERRWCRVRNAADHPNYDFTDSKEGRRPFECYVFAFDRVTTDRFRIFGRAGGVAHFTSLSFLGLLAAPDGEHPLALHRPVPVPELFKYVSAHLIQTITRHFTDAIGLSVQPPFLEFYSDVVRPSEHWRRAPSQPLSAENDVWTFLGLQLGWLRFQERMTADCVHEDRDERGPYIEYYFDHRLARVCAPVVVDGVVLTTLVTENPVPVEGAVSIDWLDAHFGIRVEPRLFRQLMESSFPLTRRQLRGTAGILGYVARELATVATNRLYQRRDTMSTYGYSDFSRRIVRESLSIIEQRVTTPLSVQNLADAMRVSPSHLSHVFRSVTGDYPSRIIARRKIEYGKMCLRHYGFSVTDTAELLGYSPSHFYRLFKTYVGVSPRTFASRRAAP